MGLAPPACMTADAVQPMEVRDRFLADHREIETLLGRVLDAFEADDRQQVAEVWTEFDSRLNAHMDAEERFLIPVLQRRNERAARAILEEHRHFRARLTQLCTEVDLHTVRLHEARGLIDELRAHSAHEDRMLYSTVGSELGPSERSSLFDALTRLGRSHRGSRAAALTGIQS